MCYDSAAAICYATFLLFAVSYRCNLALYCVLSSCATIIYYTRFAITHSLFMDLINGILTHSRTIKFITYVWLSLQILREGKDYDCFDPQRNTIDLDWKVKIYCTRSR